MLRKRMAPTLLALLLPLSLLALAGCGGSKDTPLPPQPPPLSDDAGITDISISLGELSPAFSPGLKNYTTTVGHLGEDAIAITVTLKDPKARLTINGLACASGSGTNVQLFEPINTVRVLVVAEDGRTDNAVALTVSRLALNTGVWVLNGIGGVPVANTKLTLTDSEGKVLADNVPLPREKNGKAIFGLDPRQKYNIYARGDNAAVACFANFDPAKENTATLYCLRNYTTFYEMEAPVIEEIAFATANSSTANWKTMANSAHYVGPAADVAAVRVTAVTRNLIAVGFSGAPDYDPIRINMDEVASPNSGGAMGLLGTAIETNVPIARNGRTYYRTTHRFNMPLLNANIFNKEHYLDIVAYDIIGNRTEQRVYLTITDSTNQQTSDANLTAVTPSLFYTQSVVYMGAGDLPVRPGEVVNALDPVDPYTASQMNTLQFYVRTVGTTTDLGIRGYEVWRSNGNDSNFVKIATRHYATPTTGSPFTFEDCTPTLAEGDVWYMVRVFNGNPANNGYSQFSVPFKGRVMPPTTTGPAASHLDIQDKLWPTFRIAAGNPKMLRKETSDRFHFTLFVKNSTNAYPFLMVPFRVNFTESELIGTDPESAVNKHRYGFPQGKPTVEYMQVTSYTGTTSTIGAGTWNYASDATTIEGETTYTPFAYLDNDGSVVINTDSARFQTAMQNAVRSAYSSFVDLPYFRAGVPYIWNLFGNQGGIFWNAAANPARWTSALLANAAYFTKGYNEAPNATSFLGVSVGSNMAWGLGSPEGWFTLIIDPDAK